MRLVYNPVQETTLEQVDDMLLSYDDEAQEASFTCSSCGADISFLSRSCTCGESVTGSIEWQS